MLATAQTRAVSDAVWGRLCSHEWLLLLTLSLLLPSELLEVVSLGLVSASLLDAGGPAGLHRPLSAQVQQ